MDADLLRTWNGSPSIGIGVVLIGIALIAAPWRERPGIARIDRPRLVAVVLGTTILWLALASPLDAVADRALFSAHMVQHLTLLLVVPALLLAGASGQFLSAVGRVIAGQPALRAVTHPIAIAGIATGFIWVWHVPRLYEATLHDELLHAFEHLCFLLSATAFWWPVLRPSSYPWKVPDPFLVIYLFSVAVGSSLVGVLIAFSPTVIYPTYASPSAYPALHAALGLTPEGDQQLGALVMWVGMGLWYVVAALGVVARWFARSQNVDAPTDVDLRGVRA